MVRAVVVVVKAATGAATVVAVLPCGVAIVVVPPIATSLACPSVLGQLLQVHTTFMSALVSDVSTLPHVAKQGACEWDHSGLVAALNRASSPP